jgi:hypothetical protein
MVIDSLLAVHQLALRFDKLARILLKSGVCRKSYSIRFSGYSLVVRQVY